MAEKDYDVMSLAAYLHLTPQKVERLANREKLPGRKVGGKWVFSDVDIHWWLENEIGLADTPEDIDRLEGVLNRNEEYSEIAPEEMTIGALLQPSAIACPLLAKTRTSIIDAMVHLGMQTGLLWDEKKLAQAVRRREELHTTAFENGVALLHARRPMPGILGGPFLTLGKLYSPVPFGSGVPATDIFFLVASFEDSGHLKTLAKISRIISTPGVLTDLRDAETAMDMWNVLVTCERTLYGEG